MTQVLKTVKSTIASSMVCSEDGLNTYVVRKKFTERTGNKALIVQLYPTLTEKDIDTVDTTMLHLLNHLDDLDLKEVAFVNLFSKVCRVRPSVKELAVDTTNLEQIEKIMREDDFADWKVIVAWGSSMEQNVIATQMKREIIKLYREIVPTGVLWQLTADDIYMKNESAVHALYMGIRHKNSRWKLEKYQIPEVLIREEQPKNNKSNKGKGKKKELEQAPKQSDKVVDMATGEILSKTTQNSSEQEERADV